MYDSEVLSGKWDELARVYGPELQGREVEIRVLPERTRASKMIYEGMFPGLAAVTEADFESAQRLGPKQDEI